MIELSPASRRPLRRALLRWFDASKRALPWRETRDPYRRWLSEVMLQQTQVATVLPYYERFLARFPSVESLASAPLPAVLAAWTGLGYYARARNLHRAARQLAESGFPRDAAGLQRLPGFGRYTASAVASMAFGERVAVFDGNVARVLSRVLACEEPLGSPASTRTLWGVAEQLVDPVRPGDHNEAMMELGASLCVPAAPRCPACPLRRWCRALAEDRVALLPVPKARAKVKDVTHACALILSKGRLTLVRREERGLFGGLWELPSAICEAGEGGAEALARLGLGATTACCRARVERRLTHRRLRFEIYECAPTRRRTLPGYVEIRRVRLEELPMLGMATAMRSAIAQALDSSPKKCR